MARPKKGKKNLANPIYIRLSDEAKNWLNIQVAKIRLERALKGDNKEYTMSDFTRDLFKANGMPE